LCPGHAEVPEPASPATLGPSGCNGQGLRPAGSACRERPSHATPKISGNRDERHREPRVTRGWCGSPSGSGPGLPAPVWAASMTARWWSGLAPPLWTARPRPPPWPRSPRHSAPGRTRSPWWPERRAGGRSST
jgi:hypothetical protein